MANKTARPGPEGSIVQTFGGFVVTADASNTAVVPADLSFGDGEPLFASAPVVSNLDWLKTLLASRGVPAMALPAGLAALRPVVEQDYPEAVVFLDAGRRLLTTA